MPSPFSILGMAKTPTNAAVGRWMKDTREALRMSQMEFARHINRKPYFVVKTELGERRLDVIEFVELSKALGSTPRKMFDRLLTYLS
jgi:transcriptional regulator with XRE-family HTH domain